MTSGGGVEVQPGSKQGKQNASDQSQGQQAASDSIILEEEIDPDYVPTQDEVREYAKWLGMDLDKDLDLFWIAKEGLKAPLPDDWKPCKTQDTEEIYYFNFATGESTWDHPCDDYYRKLYEEEKKKKLLEEKAKNDKSKQQAKKDVDQLLGKDKKKKKRNKTLALSVRDTTESAQLDLGQTSPSPKLSIFDRKPLPGIGKQPLPGLGRTAPSASSLAHSDMRADTQDVSPSRSNTPSFLGQRLSNHLSASAGSDVKSEGPEVAREKSAKVLGTEDCKHKLEDRGSEHQRRIDDELHELELNLSRAKANHAQDLQVVKKVSGSLSHEESKFCAELASRRKEWELTLAEESQQARVEALAELERIRREALAEQEEELKVIKAQTVKESGRLKDTFSETVVMERRNLEAELNELRLMLKAKDEALQEQLEKKDADSSLQGEGSSRVKLLHLERELEELNELNSQLESQLKEARNASGLRQVTDDKQMSAVKQLQEEVAYLEASMRRLREENADLRMLSPRVSTSALDSSKAETAMKEVERLTNSERELGKELTLAKKNLAEAEEARDVAAKVNLNLTMTRQVGYEEIAALEHETEPELVEAKLKIVNLVNQTNQLEKELEMSQKTGREQKLEATRALQDKKGIQAELESTKAHLADLMSKIGVSQDEIKTLRREFQSEKDKLDQAQKKISDLVASLHESRHEGSLAAEANEQLRQEAKCLRDNLEGVLADQKKDNRNAEASQGAMEDELKWEELSSQLAMITEDRNNLVAQLATAKQEAMRTSALLEQERDILTEKSSKLEKGMEALQNTADVLEAEVVACRRCEHGLHSTEMSSECDKTTPKLNDCQLQMKTLLDDRNTAIRQLQAQGQGKPVVGGSNGGRDLQEALQERDRALKEAEENASLVRKTEDLLRLANDQVKRLQGSLHEANAKLIDQQVDSSPQSRPEVPIRVQQAATETRLSEASRNCSIAEGKARKAEDDRLKLEAELKDTQSRLDSALVRLSEITGEHEAMKVHVHKMELQDADLREDVCQAKEIAIKKEKEASGLHHKLAALAVQVESAEQEGLQTELSAARSKLQDALSSAQRSQDRVESAEAQLRELERCRANEKELAHKHHSNLLAAAGTKQQDRAGQKTGGVGVTRGVLQKELANAIDDVEGNGDTPSRSRTPNQLGFGGDERDASDASNHSSGGILLQKLTEESKERSATKYHKVMHHATTKSWFEKLKTEKHLLSLARQAVKKQKERVKARQRHLSACQDRWRNQKQELRSPSQNCSKAKKSARLCSLAEAKKSLDVEVDVANRLMEQLRSNMQCLNNREKKIRKLETLLSLRNAPEADSREEEEVEVPLHSPQRQTPSSTEGSSVALRLQELEQIE
ncbi:unnamed protein product, partial [Discosporangium mesarthrocarpum]